MAILDTIRSRARDQGLTQAELLRRAKLNASFFQDHRKRSTNPTIGSLRKIADVLGCDVHDLLTEAETTIVQREVTVVGAVEEGVWRSGPYWPEEKQVGYAIVKNPALEALHLYALDYQDSDGLFPPGTKLVCVDFAELAGRAPQPGDLVIVHRRRGGGADALVEVTCRRVAAPEPGERGLRLEDGRGIRRPADAEGVEIVALVVQDFREYAV